MEAPLVGQTTSASRSQFWIGAIVGVTGIGGLNLMSDPRIIVHWVGIGLALLVVLPCLMAGTLLLAGLTISLVLGVIGSLVWLCQPARTIGFWSLVREAVAPGLSMLPGYLQALRRVRKPLMWGMVAGMVLGAILLVILVCPAELG